MAPEVAIQAPTGVCWRAPRVALISELYYPEQTSTGHLVTQLAEALAVRHSVFALCGQPTYSKRGTRAPATEYHEGVSIVRCWSTTLDKDRPLFKLANMTTLSASVAWRALRLCRRGDVVLVFTNPPVMPFLARIVTSLRGATCVLVVHDLYPDALIAAGMLRPDGIPARLLTLAHHWLYRRVDAVSVVGRDMRDLLLKKASSASSLPVVVIPNWADTIAPEPRHDNVLLRDLRLTEKFVVQYAGNMGRVHGIETLFESARTLAATASDVHFVFIGDGAKKRWLENAVAAASLSNVTILGHLPRSDQQRFLNACDVSLSAFVPGMTGAGVPSRMYNVMAVGKPMIAAVDPASEQALVIGEEDIGWVVPPDQPALLVEAIMDARKDPARLSAMGRRARQAVDRRYLRTHALEKYESLISSLRRTEADR